MRVGWLCVVGSCFWSACGALVPIPETGPLPGEGTTATPTPSGTATETPTGTATQTPTPTATPPSLSVLQLQIFSPSCALASCHGTPLGAPMSLKSGDTHASLVNVVSDDVGTLFRVKPGDPMNSYLVHKIKGTAGSVGGDPTQMPEGAAPLPADDIARIESWISAGALDD